MGKAKGTDEADRPWIQAEYNLGKGQTGLVVVAQRVSKTVDVQAADDENAPLPMQRSHLFTLSPAAARRMAALLMKAADVAESGGRR